MINIIDTVVISLRYKNRVCVCLYMFRTMKYLNRSSFTYRVCTDIFFLGHLPFEGLFTHGDDHHGNATTHGDTFALIPFEFENGISCHTVTQRKSIKIYKQITSRDVYVNRNCDHLKFKTMTTLRTFSSSSLYVLHKWGQLLLFWSSQYHPKPLSFPH